jgi:glycosyltransferase involved in cell wall biosynthesis
MAYYGIADLFLFLSTYDTQGLVVQEAAAASCPALVLSESAPAESITDGVTGFVTDSSTKSVVDKIEQILSDRTLLKSIGNSAFECVYIPWNSAIVNATSRYSAVAKNYRERRRKSVRVKIKRTVRFRLIKATRRGKKLRLKVIGR